MSTVVKGHTDGAAIRTNIERETHSDMIALAKQNERSLSAEIRIALRRHLKTADRNTEGEEPEPR